MQKLRSKVHFLRIAVCSAEDEDGNPIRVIVSRRERRFWFTTTECANGGIRAFTAKANAISRNTPAQNKDWRNA